MELFEELKFKFKQGNAVVQIILINLLIFNVFSLIGVLLFLFNEQGEMFELMKYLMLPASFNIFITHPWSILTYMFFHEGFFHILFNMLWLYWLGNLFQQYLGNLKTYQTYFLGGIFGGFIYMLSYNIFPAFSNQVEFSYALGASAGVLSVVVAVATLLPEYQVYLFLLGSVKLKYIALISVLLDMISIPSGNAGGHIAHIGGAAFGYLYIKLIYSESNIPSYFDNFFISIGKLFQPKIKIKYKNTQKPATNNSAKPAQKEIDSILDKISKNGYESLNAKEKEILFNASKN